VGTLIVVALRLTVPLVIFRMPLLGGVLALVVDTADLVVFNVFGFPDDYQRLDKALDLYYLTIELVVARRWAPLPRRVAGGLYAWRLVGALLFEATGARWVLLVFPNRYDTGHMCEVRVQGSSGADVSYGPSRRSWAIPPW
jgi:hypothetical protein